MTPIPPIPEDRPIQKYWTSCSDGWVTVEPSDKGTWVRYEDREQRIAKLTAEVERLKAERGLYARGLEAEEADCNSLHDENEKLQAENARLKAPVSDEEYSHHFFTVNTHNCYYAHREDVDALIRSRAAIKEGQ